MFFQMVVVHPPRRIYLDYIYPELHFKYFGLWWIEALPGGLMYLMVWGLGVLSLLVAAGLWYRLSTALLTIGYIWFFLIDQAQFQNHYYLLCLLCLLMNIMPAGRVWSVDARRRDGTASTTAPAWTLWLLRFQIGIVFFYGGVAKLNGDWLSGSSMAHQLGLRMDTPLIGHLFDRPEIILCFTYSGLLLDLLIVPMLLWRRTRWLAFAGGIVFCVINSNLFEIGVFPWFMITATSIYFRPDWPRVLARRLGVDLDVTESAPAPEPAPLSRRHRVAIAVLALYAVLQILVPLRHHLYPGNVAWNRMGARFSWHMRLHNWIPVYPQFYVTFPDTGAMARFQLSDLRINLDQETRMATRPDMIQQLCRYISDRFAEEGVEGVQVRARIGVALNGRPPQLLVDPSVDLAATPRTLMPLPWVSELVDNTRTAEAGRQGEGEGKSSY